MMSAPRTRLVQRLFPENENRLVVKNPLAAQNPVMVANPKPITPASICKRPAESMIKITDITLRSLENLCKCGQKIEDVPQRVNQSAPQRLQSL